MVAHADAYFRFRDFDYGSDMDLEEMTRILNEEGTNSFWLELVSGRSVLCTAVLPPASETDTAHWKNKSVFKCRKCAEI